MTTACFVESEELWIVDAETGTLKWHGQPDGYPVDIALPVPDSDDCLVLLQSWARPGYGLLNLIRIRPDGSIVWRAEQPMRAHDRYLDVEWTEQGLAAWSSSGFNVVLDPDTGRILAREFTKGM